MLSESTVLEFLQFYTSLKQDKLSGKDLSFLVYGLWSSFKSVEGKQSTGSGISLDLVHTR